MGSQNPKEKILRLIYGDLDHKYHGILHEISWIINIMDGGKL